MIGVVENFTNQIDPYVTKILNILSEILATERSEYVRG
jgi:hypothetical protein